jgi:hypothetical protein
MKRLRYKVYIAKLKRKRGWPRCVYKIGITSSADAMNRINYRGWDEPNPITDFFTDNKIMMTIWCDSYEEAYQVEQYLMELIAGSAKLFHNWKEPSMISGLTEMRIWNYEEVQKCFKFLKDWANL